MMYSVLQYIRSKKKLNFTMNGKLHNAMCKLDRNLISSWEDIIPDLANESRTGSVSHQIETLHALINHYYRYKEFCYCKKNYRLYFQRYWEHCHNSSNPDFEYIEPYIKRYENLLANKDILLAQEYYKNECLIGLENKLLHLINENPGILQKDIYSYFDPVIRNDIGSLLLQWDKCGKLKRQKKGNSYKLFLPD